MFYWILGDEGLNGMGISSRKKIWKQIKYWCQLLLLLPYGLTFLMPRNKKLWVFGSSFGRSFTDNPKYFYLYMIDQKPEQVRAVWITKNKEILTFLKENQLEGYYLYSPKGVWLSLRAKVYLYDNYSKDICYTLSGGAIKVNLWHGIPLKKIQQDNVFDYFRNPRSLSEKLYGIPRRISDEKPSNYVLCASEYYRDIFGSAFRTKRVIVADYPRNDILKDPNRNVVLTDREKRAIEKINDKKDRKIILYMPTFRESEKNFFQAVDLPDLCSFLEKEGYVFCVKLHPKSKLQAEFIKAGNQNIIVIDSNTDPYPLCQRADILVTDYSSIYFDYLLTDKPIIFFPYDLEDYLSDSRELYFDYIDFTPGVKVKNHKELKEALTEPDRFRTERQVLREKLFGTHSESGSEQLFRQLWETVI